MAALTVVDAAAAQSTDEYDAAQVHESFFWAVVCVRNGVDPQRAIDSATFPAGTSGGWQYVERDDLPDGWWEGDGAYDGRDTPYPQPCSHHRETHSHVLAAC